MGKADLSKNDMPPESERIKSKDIVIGASSAGDQRDRRGGVGRRSGNGDGRRGHRGDRGGNRSNSTSDRSARRQDRDSQPSSSGWREDFKRRDFKSDKAGFGSKRERFGKPYSDKPRSDKSYRNERKPIATVFKKKPWQEESVSTSTTTIKNRISIKSLET